ncbi:MAG: hypothetical protein HY071_01785 [Chloroflexi bacterium]|nr:hypothetical protein [Chloroflexota bacterium]
MADTTFIKRVIEPHLRRRLESRFPGRVFQERSVPLSKGSFKCDAVSDDGSIVAFFLCNRPKTATGHENSGGIKKALDDVHVLKLLPASTRLLVCTDDDFRQLVMKRSKRFGTDGIEFLHYPLPADLQSQLNDNLDASRREQRNRNDYLVVAGTLASAPSPNEPAAGEARELVPMKTRPRGLEWLRKNGRSSDERKTFSKFYPADQAFLGTPGWWFEFTTTSVTQDHLGFLNMLCEVAPMSSEFHHLRVPMDLFVRRKAEFKIRDQGHIFTLYLSADESRHFREIAGSGSIEFGPFRVD